MKTKKINARTAAFVGMLAALSAALMAINIPLPFAPSFLKFDIAELPALFAGFFLGPLSGCAVIFIKILLKLLMQGTNTAFVGEFMNIATSCIFVLPAAFIYKRMHTKKGAVIGLTAATLTVSIASIFMNAFIAFPMYSSLYGMTMDAIIGMGSSVNPLIHDSITMMIFGVFPFNIVKHGVTSLITYLVYKRCGNALRSLLGIQQSDRAYSA